LHVRSVRQAQLVRDVADVGSAERGHTERGEVVLEQLRDREAGVALDSGRAARALAEHYAGNLAEDPGKVELAQHAVDAVLGLADILEEQDRAVEVGQPRRADQRAHYRKVAAEQPAARDTGADRGDTPAVRG